MFIRRYFTLERGAKVAYWALAESYRAKSGPRQRVVAKTTTQDDWVSEGKKNDGREYTQSNWTVSKGTNSTTFTPAGGWIRTASKFQTSTAKSSANVVGNGTYSQGAATGTVSFSLDQLADISELEAATLNAAGGGVAGVRLPE